MLLLLFFSALLLLASLCSLLSFLGTCRRVQHGQHSVLVSRLSACSLFGFEALLCVAWDGADAIGRYNVLWGSCLRAPQFPRPLLLHFRGIEARFISQSLTLLLVGRAGWLHLQRRQNHLPAPPARTAPLRSSPSSALPEDSSHGSRGRKTSFQSFPFYLYIPQCGPGP